MRFSSGLLGYLLLINLITLGAMFLDKAAAKAHGSRVGEFTIFFLSLIGGVWDTIADMVLFRHKRRKPHFQVVVDRLKQDFDKFLSRTESNRQAD